MEFSFDPVRASPQAANSQQIRQMNSSCHSRREQNTLKMLCREPGIPIPGPMRQKIESSLQEDFSRVVLHTSFAAANGNRELGSVAFAFGDHIFFAEGAYNPDGPECLALLAHELAHVAQQRIARALPKERGTAIKNTLLEVEADLAAIAVVSGNQFRVAVADARKEPACWNLAGHYFLPQLMFLNAGVNPGLAQRIALWCWLPDQVEQLDAKNVAFDWLKPWATQFRETQRDFRRFDTATHCSERQYVEAVHAGLHVFTGGDGNAEAERRGRIFREGGHLSLLYRAMALHAFGDCFSHRHLNVSQNSNQLWGPILTLPTGHALDGEAADEIWHPGKWAVVCAYIRGLGRLANAYNGRSDGIVPLDEIVAALTPMLQGAPMVMDRDDKQKTWMAVVPDWSKISARARNLASMTGVSRDEAGCATHIQKVAAQLVGVHMTPMNANFPIAPWSEYYKRYRTMITRDAGEADGDRVFYMIQKYALEWSGIAVGRPLPRQE